MLRSRLRSGGEFLLIFAHRFHCGTSHKQTFNESLPREAVLAWEAWRSVSDQSLLSASRIISDHASSESSAQLGVFYAIQSEELGASHVTGVEGFQFDMASVQLHVGVVQDHVEAMGSLQS